MSRPTCGRFRRSSESGRGRARHRDAQRQEDRTARALHLPRDAARDHVTRREIAGRVVARHERARRPRSPAARLRRAAPRRCRNRGAPATVQRGGMKLHELEIGDAGAGVVRERHAVAGGDAGIGRLAKDLPCAAGRQQRRRRASLRDARPRRRRTRRRRTRPPSTMSSVDQHVIHRRSDGRQRRRRAPRARGRSRGRSHRRRAARGERCARPRGRSAGCAAASRSNARAPIDELAHIARAVLDQHADGGFVAQAVAGSQRVGDMQLGAVVGAHRRRDAALRVAGVALARRRPWSG